jgi:outer membrane protein OmpA-like peptidoglycan-associated protein
VKKLAVALSALILVSGCQMSQRQNATTGETETNSATTGAIIGVVSGAIVGLATGKDADDRKKRALIGATTGGAIGAGVGYYFDKQEAALREELMNSGVQVKRVGEDKLVLIMQNGIGFDSGSDKLSTSIYQTLDGVAKVLVEYPDTQLLIEGHTDSSGSESLNKALSEKRANSVKAYLQSQKVAANRLFTEGLGESLPICDNSTKAGRTCNRRVEISIFPAKK